MGMLNKQGTGYVGAEPRWRVREILKHHPQPSAISVNGITTTITPLASSPDPSCRSSLHRASVGRYLRRMMDTTIRISSFVTSTRSSSLLYCRRQRRRQTRVTKMQ